LDERKCSIEFSTNKKQPFRSPNTERAVVGQEELPQAATIGIEERVQVKYD